MAAVRKGLFVAHAVASRCAGSGWRRKVWQTEVSRATDALTVPPSGHFIYEDTVLPQLAAVEALTYDLEGCMCRPSTARHILLWGPCTWAQALRMHILLLMRYGMAQNGLRRESLWDNPDEVLRGKTEA